MWTLVGGGVKTLAQSGRPMESLLPKGANWLKDSVATFEPTNNRLVTEGGDVVNYEFLVVAMRLELRYEKIKGLPEAFDTPGVGSNYSVKYVEKTQKAIEDFKGRGINVHLRQHLVEIKPETKEAVFENLDTNEKTTVPYDMIHITPPMGTPPALNSNADLVDAGGFLNVDKETLQHTKYPNIFGIGDCTSVPVAKTAAAVAAQLGIMRKNLGAAISGSETMPAAYTGYTSCPLVTGKSSLILAEFDFQAPPQPMETFPFNQAKERWTMYQLKAHFMPALYWHGLVKGWWEGPGLFRKIFRLGRA